MDSLRKSIVENEIIALSKEGFGKTDKIDFSYTTKNTLRNYYNLLVTFLKKIYKLKKKLNFK